jgi:hypothetical protein
MKQARLDLPKLGFLIVTRASLGLE